MELLHGSKQSDNNAIMWILLQCGVLNPSNEDKVWDSVTHCMYYLATIGCHLWGLLASKRTRISLHALLLLPWIDCGDREINWRGSIMT